MADETTTPTEETTETTTEEVATEAAAEAPAAEEKKAEEPKVEAKAEPTGKFAELIKQIEGLSALELAELVKALEERFGVSAAAPMMMGAMPAAGGAAAAEPAEEKTHYTLVLADGGAQKIAVIKAIREILPDLGLKEAKDLVDGAPKTVKENMPKADAEEAKKKIDAAGGKAELK